MTEAGLYRQLPRMNEILEDPEVTAWLRSEGFGREFGRQAATAFLDRLRQQIAAGAVGETDIGGIVADLVGGVARAARQIATPRLRRVVNATGVVVHTNLGRAPWSAAAAARVAELASAYSNLEYDLDGGSRGGRDRPVAHFLSRLLPGFDVAVVNNNAAAVLLVLNTLAEGREVVVSRGQMVEIGGSFRIPEVMSKGFCRLREVGTTNRTHIEDFRAAIGPQTALLLAVHPSNYRIVGFTSSVPLEQLVQLGETSGVMVAEDLGSGTLVELADWGVADEPTVAQSLAAGVDLVTFSGDKLLGGPQAGFIVGKPEAVARIRANPLYRALRLDKAALLALEATLRDYVVGHHEQIPTLAMLAAPQQRLRERAEALVDQLLRPFGSREATSELVRTQSRVGGGAAPEVGLPSWGVALTTPLPAEELARRLRLGDPAVVGRINEDHWTVDVRTLLDGDEVRLVAALTQALDGESTVSSRNLA